MGLFKSKLEKETEKKMLLKKTINQMNKKISDLEGKKAFFIEKAKKAKKEGIADAYNYAVIGLKTTISQQKKTQELLLNFEIVTQIKDMTEMNHSFLQGLSILSKDMLKLTKAKDFAKIQAEFEQAMASVENQAEQMELFLDSSRSEFETFSGDANAVTDAEIAALINEEVAQDEISSDNIEEEIKRVQQLKNN